MSDQLPGEVAFVRHPRARRYVVRVRDDGTVRVTIPRGGSARAARAFLGEQQAWVDRQRLRVRTGQSAPIERLPAERVRALLRTGRGVLVPRLLELAAREGLAIARVSIRNQRGRWGSCSPKGHITLNWRLMRMPDWIRDYVMIHELMHLKRLDHSKKFWTPVAAACQDYQAARVWLREHQTEFA